MWNAASPGGLDRRHQIRGAAGEGHPAAVLADAGVAGLVVAATGASEVRVHEIGRAKAVVPYVDVNGHIAVRILKISGEAFEDNETAVTAD